MGLVCDSRWALAAKDQLGEHGGAHVDWLIGFRWLTIGRRGRPIS